jgi:uncharacterized protein (TIGR00297 family)
MELAPHAEIAAAAAVLLAVAARALGAVTTSGAVAGVAIGCGVAAGFGGAGFLTLGVFFVAGSLLTKAGWATKTARGAAEATEGARDHRRVVGKGAVAAGLGVAAALGAPHPWAFLGAIAAALADTAGTEIGTLSARPPRTLPAFRAVPHGTPGAVSLAGLAASGAAALLIAGTGLAFFAWMGDELAMPRGAAAAAGVVSAAGFLASLAESLVVGFAPGVRRVPGWVRNLFTTLAGAALGAAGARAVA